MIIWLVSRTARGSPRAWHINVNLSGDALYLLSKGTMFIGDRTFVFARFAILSGNNHIITFI